MEKIQTIFDRDWEGNRKCIDKYIADPKVLEFCVATEKVDGMNIRLTIRSGQIMRVEKRRNPTKQQKVEGITTPWYVDADQNSNQDKWLFDAVENTGFTKMLDGQWSAEAYGKNIQGNPLNMEGNKVFVFSLWQHKDLAVLKDVPITFDGVKEYLLTAKSTFNPDCGIEGIVWHSGHNEMFKIKKKDFMYK